ncbi:nucleoside-diphosphate-sugar epimerase [Bellilinea caldifistulae]|nr:NAD-dependent epimerase/dehydratase family protein [Bellilinea caldifistulae]GAP10752.1 nucleoside-diphosphate-sugar epimerase [Bellilinea caldifistulae]
MKILVTGGAGFIGSTVVDLLLQDGHDVVIVDNLVTGRYTNINPAATFYQLDIRSSNLSQIFEKERPDVVNHHAAQMDVRRSVADPLYDADVNVKGSLNVLECARKYDVRQFIYASSGGTVYGEPKYLPCDEEHPIQPICQYGATKYMTELYLYMYRVMYGLDYVVFRYPNVYGPRQDPKGEAGVVAIFTGQMSRNEAVTIHGDGLQERDFVFVDDVAEANRLALSLNSGGYVYNLGTGQPTNVIQIFEGLKVITHYTKEVQFGPARLGETRRIYLDSTKFQAETGWKPKTSLLQGLSKTVEFFRQTELVN